MGLMSNVSFSFSTSSSTKGSSERASNPPSLLAMPKMAGLLEEMYSWHIDPFFQPKKSTNCSVEAPASAAEVAEVLLKEWKVYFSHSGRLRNFATSWGTLPLLKVDLRIQLLKLLPAFHIGLPAFGHDLLKNLLIRKNLLLHIATADNQTI